MMSCGRDLVLCIFKDPIAQSVQGIRRGYDTRSYLYVISAAKVWLQESRMEECAVETRPQTSARSGNRLSVFVYPS